MDITDVLSGIVERSKAAIPTVDGDYFDVESGLLMCGKCNTRKQIDVPMFGRVPCLCSCGVAERNKKDEEIRRQTFDVWREKAIKEGFPDRRMAEWTFAKDDGSDGKLTDKLHRYVDNFHRFVEKGQGLLLYGSVGTGKTFAACEVANGVLDRGYSVLVTDFRRILNDLQSTYDKQDYVDNLNRYKLLVIDDLGVERETEYAKEQVYAVIDARSRSGLPLVVTTNLSLDVMKKPSNISEARIYGRVLEKCYPILVEGKSHRRDNTIENYMSMKDILEGD